MDSKNLNYRKLNTLIDYANKIAKILHIALIIVGAWVLLRLITELKILPQISAILKVLTPLFIGLFLAWVLSPFVKKLENKNVSRKGAIAITFMSFILIIFVFGFVALPMLFDQVTDFIGRMPELLKQLESMVTETFIWLEKIDFVDSTALYSSLMSYLNNFVTTISESLPTFLLGLVENTFATFMNITLSLIIGYFLLDSKGHKFELYIPNRFKEDALSLMNHVDDKMRNYIIGVGIIALIIFVICTISFMFIGLPAPLLFGIFCGLTNIIPYVGPWIGGIPAVIIGLTVSPLVGLMTLIVIIIVQTLESAFLQPMVMSKAMELHPVTILVGLLIFEYFFGVLGMIFAAPIIATLKVLMMYFNTKYGWSKSLRES